MTLAERYVTAAYLALLAILLLYVVIYSGKVARLEREVAALAPEPAAETAVERQRQEPARVLEEPA